jgi:Amt family ammonium transporter
MVRRKNVLGILMQCFAILCIISLQWMLFGYSISFAPGNWFLGSLKWAGLTGVGVDPNPAYAATIPHLSFMAFQAMFAVITPALIIGAFAERMKFPAFLLYGILWATFVYDPIAHWVWGSGGWLKDLGVLDFAGGTVVHTSAGIAALVTTLLIGKRQGYQNVPIPPHNLPFTVLGAALLWFGWFGFNAGSALAANGVAITTFVVTNAAAAAGGATWALCEWFIGGRPTTFGIVTGSIAGLATVTPASGFISPLHGIIVGMIAGLVCFACVGLLKPRAGYDDSLDAFGVHGAGGVIGTTLTGVFASKIINSAGNNGLLLGNTHQLIVQLIAVGATVGYTAVMTFVIYKLVDLTVGIRVSEKEEFMGLDLTQHREAGYTLLE